MSNAIGLPVLGERQESVNFVTHCVRKVYEPSLAQAKSENEIKAQQQKSEQCHYVYYQIADDKERKSVNEEKEEIGRDDLKPLPAHLKYAFLGVGK
jgi:hypothetical protein